MNIFYLYSQPRKNWERQVKAGSMPDHVLYGLNYLHQLGHQVSYSDLGFSRFNLLRWPISPLQQWFRHRANVGFQLDQALVLLPQLRQADLIITTNDSCGLPIALLKYLGLLHTPQIYFHIAFKSMPYLSKLLRQPEKVICFSPHTKFHFLAPGVDTKFFRPKKVSSKFDLIAIGRDPGRDYATLFRAIKDLPIKVKVICDPKNLVGLSIPPNVAVKHFASYTQVRQAYWQAKIVVIPTKKNSVSGQISLLEALACGKPVIAANTKALKIAPTVYYQPEQPRSLKYQILRLLNHPKVQGILPNHFSSRHFSLKLNQIITSF